MSKKEPSLDEAFNAIVEGLKILTKVAVAPLSDVIEGGNRDKPKKEKKKPKKKVNKVGYFGH
tara:strand:- start:196 stop:381 length:186 start_codon:yes stop_codon:yes gene_type:complete